MYYLLAISLTTKERKKYKKDVKRCKNDLKRRKQMVNSHIKRHSTSLVIREVQIKITVGFKFISIRIANTQKDQR